MCKGVNKILMDIVKEYSVEVNVQITKQMGKFDNHINVLPKKKLIRFNKNILKSIPKCEICDFVAKAMIHIYDDEKCVYIKNFRE